jgi:hypothetical protein
MDAVEIARAMYEAPAPDETEGAVWPPSHPEDVGWWMSRAAAIMPLVRRAQAEALRDAAADNEHGWALRTWLNSRADRIEQEVEHEWHQ